MEKLKPKLFSVIRSYNNQQFLRDMIAGIIVAIIALPLSIAFALGCGVSPEKGIYSAIISSIIIGVLGGSRVQITGPTGAFIVITQSIIGQYGLDGLMIATILSGLMLVLSGVFRLGKYIKYIPAPITIGFTGGIAVTIFTLEIKDFLGLEISKMPTSFLEKWRTYIENISTINWQSIALGAFCIVVLVIWPKLNKVIPNSFVAILIGTAIAYFLRLDVKTLGEIPKTLSLPNYSSFSFQEIFALMKPAFTIAVLVAMQALLSAVVTDEMIGSKHRANMELIAQGIANALLGFLGCIPATGGVARSIANAKNGGRTPIASMFHGITLFLFLLLCMPFIKYVPLCVLAAILLVVSFHMFNIQAFLSYRKAPKSDMIVLVLSCILTFAFDLILAIEIGIILSCVLFMRRMAEVTDIKGWIYETASEEYEEENDPDHIRMKKVPKEVLVYEISGPLFFGAADKFTYITAQEGIKVIILRMRSVPAIDVTALNTMRTLCRKLTRRGITIIFSHVLEQPMSVMRKTGFDEKIGLENFCDNIDDALARASELCNNNVI